ncbi:phospholipase D-like domain-containing protein [Burkholderia cepacia]|uniref:phospholipase D-like domain-containing protein n=1 Tax=Burkholderia cepacia TaxID=292 RepID=UPI000AF7FAD0|nr:phospholipase D-like domain-containing protein [Burkholderia cepacia]
MSPDIRTDHSQNQDRTPKVVDDQLTAQQNSLLSQLAAEQASLQQIQSQGANPFDDSHPDNWLPVYVHAKLMTVDDAFMTLGSANVNIRSMNVDSELNICHENSDVTKPLRRKLWGFTPKTRAPRMMSRVLSLAGPWFSARTRSTTTKGLLRLHRLSNSRELLTVAPTTSDR